MLLTTSFVSLLLMHCFLFSNAEERVFKNSVLKFKTKNSLQLDVTGDSVNFFVIADQGGIDVPPYSTYVQRFIADLMADLGTSENTHFQFALGDNFYYDGVMNVTDERFNTSFEDVFTNEHLKNTPWFFCLGNHDYRGNIREANASAQIEYTQVSKRWILPDFLYDIDINLNRKLLMKVIVIDTQLICDEGNATDRENYLRKFEQMLKSVPYSPYLIVAGHYPVWSIGDKGTNFCMVDKVRPLLHKYKVAAYFCGDEHMLEYIVDDYMDHKVEHVISGATNLVLDSNDHINTVSKDKIKYIWYSNNSVPFIGCPTCLGALALVKADSNSMSFKFIDTKKEIFYSFEIKNNGNVVNFHYIYIFFSTLFVIIKILISY